MRGASAEQDEFCTGFGRERCFALGKKMPAQSRGGMCCIVLLRPLPFFPVLAGTCMYVCLRARCPLGVSKPPTTTACAHCGAGCGAPGGRSSMTSGRGARCSSFFSPLSSPPPPHSTFGGCPMCACVCCVRMINRIRPPPNHVALLPRQLCLRVACKRTCSPLFLWPRPRVACCGIRHSPRACRAAVSNPTRWCCCGCPCVPVSPCACVPVSVRRCALIQACAHGDRLDCLRSLQRWCRGVAAERLRVQTFLARGLQADAHVRVLFVTLLARSNAP
jgi:hypothetical protein